MFDTETMAELCVKQGLLEEAIEIYQRMASACEDPATRRRYDQRITTLGAGPGPLASPGLRVRTREGEIEVEWSLPADTGAPALQVLVLRRTPSGIEAQSRTIPLDAEQGRTRIAVTNLHSARAAAGRLVGETFVPIVRLA